ncbi:MAG TPA: hypothetical protein VGK46_03445, partial [Saprospiraceae bacterium]
MQDIKQIIMGLLLLAGSLASCVKDPKDIPPGVTESPDFGMKANFGNEVIDIVAGTDQWTMLPVVEHQDSLDVYTAVFSKNGCLEQCQSSWTFRFFQALPDELDPEADFNNTIQPGVKTLVLSDQELDSFDIQLSTHPGLFMSGFSFWDDSLAGIITYDHQYETVLGYQDSLGVCFQSLAYTGCHYNQCVYFDPATLIPCIVSIEARVEGQYVSLSVRPQGTPPFKYQWYNEATSQSIVVRLQDSFSVADIYAGVIVTDALGNRAELLQTIRYQDGIVDACYFPINLSSQLVDNTLASNFANHVEITYVDEQGV